jgi:hypothetical protein
MHITKKRKKNYKKKEKSHYSDLFFKTALLTPPRQHQKFSFSKSDVSKKGTVQKRHRHPIIDLRPRKHYLDYSREPGLPSPTLGCPQT